ncbi:MAG: Fe-S cluster assembly ATPase SufC [Candidatus Omnitrophica bacterium CG11_big_fil_rev_8_21_14_0_20_64_10]|nr:MAG: Fe-S cluster assembly ATPase SufC [Candidatus Omnitrophica bacterium CG11_big_fil_rev_8_21_14_0_20_64_10]
MSQPLLEIKNLHVTIEGKPILKGISLTVNRGEVHALMGPNGSGKSTLSNVLMGHPKYTVTQGTILFQGEDYTALSTDARARAGIFLAFQYPTAIPGVSVANFVRTAMKARFGEAFEAKSFRKSFKGALEALGISENFATRYVNDGFSGGEKKRHEVLQMTLLKPRLAILDETDSGLDIDALKTVSEGINRLRGPELGILLITHYQRILDYVQPDKIHVLKEGQIVRSGGKELALELEKTGYKPYETEAAEAHAAGAKGVLG